MRACFTGCGLDVTIDLDDKESVESGGDIECTLPEWKKPKLVLHVVDEVTGRGHLCEPGFDINAKPRHSSPEFRTRYDLFLSKERFRALTNPEGDPVIDGGYFVSRSIYDRVDIKYFALRPRRER